MAETFVAGAASPAGVESGARAPSVLSLIHI